MIVSFLSFLYCEDWGSKCVKYSGLVTKYVNKVFAGFSIFEVIRIIEFVQANGYLCAIN